MSRSLLFLILVGILRAAPAPEPQSPKPPGSLPDGSGKDVITEKCQFCHNNDRVVSARMTKAGWAESVDRMIDRRVGLWVPVVLHWAHGNWLLPQFFGPLCARWS